MNYRHAFHAGNAADVMKHAILLHLLAELLRDPAPLTMIDTHAGAGLYDLGGPEASRTGEAASGVLRLMDATAPLSMELLKAAVRRANRAGETRLYPGSPLLMAWALRPRDRLIACELRPDDYAALKGALPRQAGAEVLKDDGYEVARRAAKRGERLLLVVDPPYERPDDPARAAELIGETLARNPDAVIALWAPIKDLDGFDSLTGRVEDASAGAPLLVAETRFRPLTDPMRLNGSALLVANAPEAQLQPTQDIVAFVAQSLGEPGARGEARFI